MVDDGSVDGTAAVVARHEGVTYLHQATPGPRRPGTGGGGRQGRRSSPSPTTTPCPRRPGSRTSRRCWPTTRSWRRSAAPSARFAVRARRSSSRSTGWSTTASTPTGSIRYLITANLAIRRSALEAVDGFDESFPGASGEDTDLTWRLQAAGFRLATTDAAVVRHRHPERWGDVLRLFAKHGRSVWPAAASPSRGGSAGRAPSGAASILDAATGSSAAAPGRPARAFGYLLFRHLGLAVMAWNIRRG